MPKAANYAGTTHPLVVIGPTDIGWGYDIQNAYGGSDPIDHALLPTSTHQVQLVAYVSIKDVPAGTCGSYVSSEGKGGEVLRDDAVTTIDIVEARTGKAVASKSFVDKAPQCASSYSSPELGRYPPWYLSGVPPRIFGTKAVDHWIAGFLHGPVRG